MSSVHFEKILEELSPQFAPLGYQAGKKGAEDIKPDVFCAPCQTNPDVWDIPQRPAWFPQPLSIALPGGYSIRRLVDTFRYLGF